MDLRRDFEKVLAHLVSTRLGALGFERKGLTIHRNRPGYLESFNFQGSHYNVRDTRCEYFLNVGIGLPDLSRKQIQLLKRGNGAFDRHGRHTVSLSDFSPDIAWATRARELVRGLPERWKVEPGFDAATLAESLATAVLSASDALVPFTARVRLRAAPFRLFNALRRPVAQVLDRAKLGR